MALSWTLPLPNGLKALVAGGGNSFLMMNLGRPYQHVI